MCTALKYKSCMGRNYDYEQSYNETIVNIPEDDGNAIIGICTGFVEDYPLLYDGMNNHGLCCSALAFTGNACYDYKDTDDDYYKLPPYDFVRHILAKHKNVWEVKRFLEKTDIISKQYSEDFPNSDLHWFICDRQKSITVEATENGLNVYDNQFNVLTNNPPFPLQAEACVKQNSLIGTYSLVSKEYMTRGTETYGILGDTTSMSRFQRVYQYKKMMENTSDFNSVNETFHLLGSVEQTYGATSVNDSYEYTIYKAAYDMDALTLSVLPYDNMNVITCHLQTDDEWRMTL